MGHAAPDFAIAMQKVMGSSPIIRSRIPAKTRILFIELTTMNGTLSR